MATPATVIGLPKEIKTDEHRVALTPMNVKALAAAGFRVHVEKGAGVGSGHADDEYAKAGAQMEGTHAAVFAKSTLIVKVKEPIASEYPLIQPHHTVFTFFHLAGSRELTEAMLSSGATCIAYETIERPDGSLPILAPMSEIAGRLSIQMGMRFLEKTNGGSGILLAGVPGVLPGTVVVIGGGVAGANAAIVAAGTGARVILMDNNIARLRQLASWMPNNVQTAFSSSASIEQHLAQADLAIGAALVAGARAPVLVSEAALRSMKPGSVFVDIAIDQGGMTAASKPTTHRDPVMKIGDTTLYCVANMPGCVPRTSTEAITNAATPYLMQIAKLGWGAALSADPGLLLGLNVTDGKLTLRAVADQFDLPFHEPAPLAAVAANATGAGSTAHHAAHHAGSHTNGNGPAPTLRGGSVLAKALATSRLPSGLRQPGTPSPCAAASAARRTLRAPSRTLSVVRPSALITVSLRRAPMACTLSFRPV